MLKNLINEFKQLKTDTKDDLLQKQIIAEKISKKFSFGLFYTVSSDEFCTVLEAFLFAGAVSMGVPPVIATPLSKSAAKTFCMVSKKAIEEMEGFDD